MKMPPQNRTLITPPEGWEPESWYQVEVSFNRNNPVHRALLFTGFLHDGHPGNYHYLTSSGWEEISKLDELHYLSPLKHLGRLTKADYEEDGALQAENDRLLEGKVQDAETIHVLEQALTKCVASLDQLLPYLAKVPADVGLLNDALVAARPLLESEGPDYPDGCDKDGFPGGCERMGCKGKCQ